MTKICKKFIKNRKIQQIDFSHQAMYTKSRNKRQYSRDGDFKSVPSGRDEDLKLIPIAEKTVKNRRKGWLRSSFFHTISRQMKRGSGCYEGAMRAGESFKERIRQEAIKEAKRYKEIYVDYEYLICSEAFAKRKYYIINAEKDNFQHLTGVHSKISAQAFFDKCVDGSLSEQDFDFAKKGQDEKSVKGTVRRKIRALPEMMDLFREGLQAEEGFKKNKVVCSFAVILLGQFYFKAMA